VFVLEDARVRPKPARGEWAAERDPDRIAQMLNDSAKVVPRRGKNGVESGRDMKLHYDHPILMLQHMIWHEGYITVRSKRPLKSGGPSNDR